MAKRRPSKHLREPRPLGAGTLAAKRTVGGRTFIVKQVTSGHAVKPYRCPGCQHEVRAGTAHVVVWPDTAPLGYESGLEVRRHWHKTCWERAS